MDKYELLKTDEVALSVTPGVYYPKNRHQKRSSRKINTRVIKKTGEFNIEICKTRQRWFPIFSYLFLSMVNARWRWTLFNFFSCYIGEWLVFAFAYWLIAIWHGDLDLDHLPQENSTRTPCINHIYGFTSALLFSAEVHTTLAYGKRSITLECPLAISTMCLQCIFSSIFQAFMVGILFAKLSRPNARAQTILFSKNAVITMRNHKYCLIFRVGDMRKSRLLNIKVSAYIIRCEMESLCLDDSEQMKLETKLDGCEPTFFLWPMSVVHVIDETSPLYNVSAVDLLCGKLEILVVFESIIESTGQQVQARSSYTNNQFLWGYRFLSMVRYDRTKRVYDVDYSKLSSTEIVNTPLCSAKEYEMYVGELIYEGSRRNKSFFP